MLHIQNRPLGAVAYVWYKGNWVNKNNVIAFFIMTSSFHLSGPANNGWEILQDDGSLVLKKVTPHDSGIYTVVAHLPDSNQEIGHGALNVYGE